MAREWIIKLSTHIPRKISWITKQFQLSDTADSALFLLPETITVKVGTSVMTGYTLQTTDHGFVLDFSIQQLEKICQSKIASLLPNESNECRA